MREPLTPEDCDLRDSKYMPLYVQQMLNSSFNAMADDTAWRAGVTLWLKAWHQVPAGSLPYDHEELANMAGLGRDLKTWKKISAKALRGWVECDDGRLYHPVVAEAALEVWIARLLSRISSGAGNAKKYGGDFDPAPIEAEIAASSAMLSDLNPNAEALRKLSRRKPQSSPTGTTPGVPPGSQAKAEAKARVIDDGEDAGATPAPIDGVRSTDDLGWPSDQGDWVSTLIDVTGAADLAKQDWPLHTTGIVTGWHETDRFEWRDVVAGVRATMLKVRADDPPRSWKYFSPAIARAKRDRTTATPEAQPHERRNDHYREPSQGRSTAYMQDAIASVAARRSSGTG